MTQTTETTAERVQRIVYPWAGLSFGAEEIGAEIDAKDKRIAELEAEIVKLKQTNRNLAIEGLGKLIKGVHRNGTARGA